MPTLKGLVENDETFAPEDLFQFINHFSPKQMGVIEHFAKHLDSGGDLIINTKRFDELLHSPTFGQGSELAEMSLFLAVHAFIQYKKQFPKRKTVPIVTRAIRYLKALARGERNPITSDERKAVSAKTNGLCFYCDCELPKGWHVDHFIPRSKGGEDNLSNYVPACKACNIRKHDKMPSTAEHAKFHALIRSFL